MNEWLGVGQGHLVDMVVHDTECRRWLTGKASLVAAAHLEPRVSFGEGSEELRDAFAVPPQHAVLNILQRENLSANQVAHVVKELDHRKEKAKN